MKHSYSSIMNSTLKEKLMAFLEHCHSLKEQRLKIEESISTNGDNFNRHVTSTSFMEFRITDFMVRFSGARARFEGEAHAYEIGIDLVVSLVEKEDQALELIEKYGEAVYRKTLLVWE